MTEETLPGELAAQIKRVTIIREHTKEAGDLTGKPQSVAPLLFMLDRSLKAAIAAAGSPDIEGQIQAVEDLRGYES